MKMRKKQIRTVSCFLFFLLLVLPLQVRVSADSSSGSGDVNNISPVIESAGFDRARSDDYYQLSLTVRDNNSLNDLSEIEVVVWHSVDASYAGADDSSNHYTFKWNSSGWTEETLSGHLVSSTEPSDLSVASDTWTANLTFTDSTSLGNYTARITVDDGTATATSDLWVIRDKLAVADYSRDVENRKLYARLQYASDSTDIENGTISYAGLTASANSTGWAELSLAGASDFSWNTVCYPVEDADYEVTEIDLNQTIPLAKAGAHVIGGNAKVESASYSDPQLFITFNLSSADYTTTVSGAKPTYVIGDTYDLDSDYTTYLSLDHDGQLDFTLGYPNWGGTYVRGLTYGWFETVSLVSNTLTLVANKTVAGTGTAYIDCTGRGSPQRTLGFDTGTTVYDTSTSLLYGEYTLNGTDTVTLSMDWSATGGGGGGGGGGDTSRVNIRLSEISVAVQAGSYVTDKITATWSGTPGFYITDYTFNEHPEWFEIFGEEPLRIDSADPVRSDTINVKVDVPRDVEIGNTTMSYILQLRTATGGANVEASGTIQLDVLDPDQQLGPPATGIIPNMMGLLLGLGLVGAIGFALFKRNEDGNRSGSVFS